MMTIRSRKFILNKVKISAVAIAAALLLAHCGSKPPVSLVTPMPPAARQPTLPKSQEPVRGVWLTTVSRLDWPPLESVNGGISAERRIALQQQALAAVRNDYSLARLYAMGADAWSLANHFSQMRQVPGFELNGNTGDLSANQDCVINRKLSWLKYQQGQIVPAS